MRTIITALALVWATFSGAETLIVGVEQQDFHPHYWVDKDQQYQGFGRDLLDEFARQNGHKLVYKPYPAEALTQALLKGEIHLKYPDHPEWAKGQKSSHKVAYSQPIVDIIDGTLVNPIRKYKGISQVKKLGMIDGFSPWIYQKQIDEAKISTQSTDSLKQLIRAGLKNKVDGVYYNVVVATYYMDNIRQFPLVLVFDETLPFVKSNFRMSSISKPDVVKQMDQFLRDQSQRVAKLKEEYEVERNIDTEFVGLEQWRINFMKKEKL